MCEDAERVTSPDAVDGASSFVPQDSLQLLRQLAARRLLGACGRLDVFLRLGWILKLLLTELENALVRPWVLLRPGRAKRAVSLLSPVFVSNSRIQNSRIRTGVVDHSLCRSSHARARFTSTDAPFARFARVFVPAASAPSVTCVPVAAGVKSCAQVAAAACDDHDSVRARVQGVRLGPR